MAGYSRQSIADIIANAVIKSGPVNAEYNALRDTFAFATGHKHDGSSTEGAYVPLIADVDALNKVVVDTSNNRISFYSEVGAAAVEQVRIQDGAIVPVTDNDVDLGTSTLEFKDLYIDGVGYIDTIAVHENATIVGTLGVTGLSTLATVDINGGNIDATIIGGATPAAVTTTALVATTADINGGTIDGTVIGASTPAAGSFSTADIDGGTVDGAQIGAASPSTITGTTVTATNFVGPIAGAVTGNVTGNLAGNVTGDVVGDLTGNVTASSGTSSFNNVTINGSLDMNASTSATVTGLSSPVQGSDAATKTYVDAEVAAVVDSAPGALDTLNELAAALGDDAAFSTTVTNSISTKLPKAGGTMTGAIAMGTSKITGLGTPTAGTDAVTKAYTDTADALKIAKAGDTMSGVLAMGANKITGLADPTLAQDAATKTYIDTVFGSTTTAATSASNAATSETNAANSATASGNSATGSANSASAAAASFDQFDDIYLGSKSSNPTTDNDGAALATGALHFNTTAAQMRVYDGASWAAAGSAVNGTSDRVVFTATASQTTFSATYNAGYVDVYLNGIKLVLAVDYVGTSGTSVVLTTGATVGDIVDIVAYGSFALADHYTKVASDARYELLDTSYTKAEGDARFEPIDSAYTKSEGDARYEPIDSAYTKAEADANLAALVDSSPSTLDTLNELAAALGDDANYAATTATALGLRYTKTETDAKIVQLSPPATKSHVESLGIAANSITGALPAIDGAALTGIVSLPTQTSHAGKHLTTDGSSASWSPVVSITQAKLMSLGAIQHGNGTIKSI